MGTPVAADRRPAADWGRAADGVQLAGIAVFLLLTTTGRLPWSFWIDAIALWPVLLMAAGLRMVVDRTRAPWLQLLAPALVLGTLAWLATSPQPFAPARDWQPVSVERPAGAARLRLEGNILGARLAAAAAPLPAGFLAEGRVASRRGTARLDSPARDGETASIRIQGPRHGGPFLWMPGASDTWDLRLAEGLPVTVKVGGAMSRVALDLRTGRVARATVEGAFMGTDLRLARPEKDTEIRIAGVFNSVTLSVPEGTPVRVHGAGLPFNVVDRGLGGTGPGYDVQLAGVFSAATVEARPAHGERTVPPPPPPPDSAPSPAPSPRPPAEAPPSAS